MNKLQYTIAMLLMLCHTLCAHAQQVKPLPNVELTSEQIVKNRIKQAEDKNYLSLSIENDSLASGDDSNYTSGIRLTYFNVNTTIPKILDVAATAIPTFDLNKTTSTYLSIGQNLYTPQDIEIAANQDDDRPWAGFVYGSAGLATINNNHIDELELTLGFVGPEAFGEQTQKAIHTHASGSPTPRGWSNQLDFELGLVISAGRRWPALTDVKLWDLRLTGEPNVNLSLGNIYTHAGAGLSFALGPNHKLIQDKPPRVPPALPGTGFFETRDKGFNWYLFAGADGRVVGRNIFLDGNTFKDSHSIDKKHFVADIAAGAAIAFDRYRLAYSYNVRTKEFDDQDNMAKFGSLTLSTRF